MRESYNYQEHVDMTFIDLNANLGDTLSAFVLERFGIADVDALSDEAYNEFYDKLCNIEEDEAVLAAETSKPISEYGRNVTDVVTYMGNQFIEGGKRWEDDNDNTIVQEQSKQSQRPSRFNND